MSTVPSFNQDIEIIRFYYLVLNIFSATIYLLSLPRLSWDCRSSPGLTEPFPGTEDVTKFSALDT